MSRTSWSCHPSVGGCLQAEEHPDILIVDKGPGNKKRIEDKRYEKGQGVQDEEKPKPQE